MVIISKQISGLAEFAVGKVALGQILSEYFGFPCRFSFHRMLHARLSSKAGTIDPLLTGVPPSHEFKERWNLSRAEGVVWICQTQDKDRWWLLST
jgi:hypothetical protein